MFLCKKSDKSPEERSRIRSLYIIHISMLIFSLGNSIIFTGVWPYLKLLEPDVTLEMYGFVVAADALAQMLFSPVFGLLADMLDSVRLISIVCSIIFAIGNVMYATIAIIPAQVGDFTNARVWYMLLVRFIVGIGTAVNAPCRTYLSKATHESERTTHIALFSLFQTLGFILGPAIQAALTPIGEEEMISSDSTFISDMYTATGWISATTGVCAFIIFLPGIFVEHSVLESVTEEPVPEIPLKKNPRELLKQFSTISVVDGTNLKTFKRDHVKPKQETEMKKSLGGSLCSPPRPNLIATITSTYNFFAFLCNFVLLETILTPLAMDQWGWKEEDAIFYLGITMACGGVLAGLCFATIGPLSKKFDERILFIVAGIIPMILGRVIMFPFGSELPPLKFNPNAPSNNTNTSHRIGPTDSGIEGLIGCNYQWCAEIGAITVAQFMVGYVFSLIGYPFCVALTGSIFSKVLGPIPQGFWMGLLTTAGSLARVVGPIFVSFIYQEYGTWLTFGLITGSLVISLLLTLASYTKLKPPVASEVD